MRSAPEDVAPRLLLRPAVARRDEAQVEQPAIGHGARAGADVVGELRPHQDDDRAVGDRLERRAAVAAGHQLGAPPGGAARPVLQHASPLRRAGRPGSRRRARSRAPCRAASRSAIAASIAPSSPRRRGTTRRASACSRPSTAPPPRSAAGRRRIAGQRGIGQRVHRRERQRRVQVVAQRLHAPAPAHRPPDRRGVALQRAIEAVELALRLAPAPRRKSPASSGSACAAAQPHRLAGAFASTSRTVRKLPRLFDIFSPFTCSMPLCTQ